MAGEYNHMALWFLCCGIFFMSVTNHCGAATKQRTMCWSFLVVHCIVLPSIKENDSVKGPAFCVFDGGTRGGTKERD